MTETKKPLLSIVTPCLNRASMISAAIESVRAQDYDNIEHIIVDGGSKDGTLDILSQYKHLKIISEPDKNLYDGLNKGIAAAKGEIIGHLNTDDVYAENCFNEIVQFFNDNLEIDSVCGGASVFEQKTPDNKICKGVFNLERYKTLNLDNITYGMPIINARFFRKRVYEKIGYYNIQYPIAADREFLIRAYLAAIKTLCLDKIVYYYQHHAQSLTFSHREAKVSDDLHPEYLAILLHYKSKNIGNNTKTMLEVTKACRNWHTWMVGYIMQRYLKAFDLAGVARMIQKGYREDKNFVLRYLWQKLQHKNIL